MADSFFVCNPLILSILMFITVFHFNVLFILFCSCCTLRSPTFLVSGDCDFLIYCAMLFIYLYMYIHLCMSIHPSHPIPSHPSIHLSLRQSVHPSIHPSINLIFRFLIKSVSFPDFKMGFFIKKKKKNSIIAGSKVISNNSLSCSGLLKRNFYITLTFSIKLQLKIECKLE